MSLVESRVGDVPHHIREACTPTVGMHPIQKMARETITECLPTIHYYYKKEKRNESAQRAEEYAIEWFNTWLTKHDSAIDKKYVQVIKVNQFAQFAAHCSPGASQFVSKIAATLAEWLFFSDDLIEENKDYEELADRFQQIKEICDEPGKIEDSSNPSLRALADIIVRMHIACKDALKARFTKSVEEYLKSNLWERGNIEEKRTPPVEEYLRMRYHTSATPLSFHMVELDKGLDIPDDIYQDPDVKELLRSGAFCCNNENEILSFFKEWDNAQKNGDAVIHNLVHVFMHEDTNDDAEEVKLRRAFSRTAEQLKKELETFYAQAEKVKRRDFGPYTGQVAQLADGISDWITAHHFWAVFAPRYGGPGWSPS